ncbi:MAG: type II toxin-antitoxin system RelE/ParE family toxin [Patescibacteria group bacterium]
MREWEIIYLATALADARKLDAQDRLLIEQAVNTKLAHDPETFGKPLRYTLRNYRVLRVGDWRVIFRIREHEILIGAIRHRRDGYQGIEARFV